MTTVDGEDRGYTFTLSQISQARVGKVDFLIPILGVPSTNLVDLAGSELKKPEVTLVDGPQKFFDQVGALAQQVAAFSRR